MDTTGTTTTPLRLGIYGRLSDDRDQDKNGVARQHKEAQAFVDELRQRGTIAEVVELRADRSASAYRLGARRPEMDALLDVFDAGGLDAIVAWRIDRLARAEREATRIKQRVDDKGLIVFSVADGIDTRWPAGRNQLDQAFSLARIESASLGTRVRAASRERAQRGGLNGGRYRGFGHQRDGSLMAQEAEAIQAAVERIIDGDSPYEIVSDWEAAGVLTETGRTWTLRSFKLLVQQARLAGAREVDGQLVRSSVITPIITVEQLQAVRDQLALRRGSPRRPSRELSGMVFCAACGGRMTVHGNGQGAPSYYCLKRSIGNHHAGCGSTAIRAASTEAQVYAEVCDSLSKVKPGQASVDQEDAAAALAELDRRQAVVMQGYMAGTVTQEDYDAAVAVAEQRRHQLSRRIARATVGRGAKKVLDALATADAAGRRTIYRRLGLRVSIGAHVKGGPRWQPGRITASLLQVD